MENDKKQTEKKNLLLMVPTLLQGGFERICVETARIMQQDYHVYLLVFSGEDRHYDVSGLEVIDIRLPASRGNVAKTFTLLRRRHALKKIKRKLKIDYAYSFGMTANLSNALSRTGEIVVTSLHSSLDFPSRRKMELILRGSDLTVSCADALRRMAYRQYGYKKTVLLRNPYDTEMIRRQALTPVSDLPFAGERGPVVMTMGRDDDAKGYWHLIKAFAELQRALPDARLVILGGGPMKREKELVAQLGLEHCIAILGVKKNPFPYLAAADLFVLSSNREGFPNVMIEAMSLGKTVMATDCRTGPREILLSDEEQHQLEERYPDGASTRDVVEGAYGILIPDMSDTPDYDPGRVSADDRMLATIMRRVLHDTEKSAHYRTRATERAAHFSKERYRQELDSILKRLSKR